MKILIVNTFGIGDVLFTTPLISNLKAANPKGKIGYVCNQRTQAILDSNPDIDKTYVYERDEFCKIYKVSKFDYFVKMKAFWEKVQCERYDAVVDLSSQYMVGFFLMLVGINKRVGFDFRGRGRFLTHKIRNNGFAGRPVADHYLELLQFFGVPAYEQKLQLPINDQDSEFANKFLQESLVSNQDKLVGIVPGGGASWGKEAEFKRWEPAKYAKLADKLVENLKVKIILFGDKSEVDLCQKTVALMHHPALLACGKTSINQFAALSKRCRLLVLNDGGPLHVAVAAGAKTVSIFGPVDEDVYGPYPMKGQVVVTSHIACRPCYRQFRRAACDHMSCLKNISVESVYDAVVRQFN